MKFYVVFASVLVAVIAKPTTILTPIVSPSASSQYHSQDEFGQYSYGYANGHSSKSELKTIDGITRGVYSYIDAEGKLQNVEYTADDVNGFRVVATNLPAAPVVNAESNLQPVQDTPEVAEAKAKHLIELEKVKETVEGVQLPSATYIQPITASHVGVRFSSPDIVYSYGIPSSVYHLPVVPATPIAAYAAPLPIPFVEKRIANTVITSAKLPSAPTETPEVAKARAEHLAEVEKAKARNA